MMRILMLLFLFSFSIYTSAQNNTKTSTIDFVQILDNNKEEAIYYFENNWKVLREMAIKKGYIHSYQVLETAVSEEAPFHLMLITTYLNDLQYDLREENFAKLIKERGSPTFLNSKRPADFRATLFSKELVRHWN